MLIFMLKILWTSCGMESFKFFLYKVFPKTFYVVASCPFLRDYYVRLILYKALLRDYFQGE